MNGLNKTYNTMRTLKELLIILRDNAEVHKFFLGLKQRIDTGLCHEAIKLQHKGIITLNERHIVRTHIMEKVKEKGFSLTYLFPATLWRCRKKWLNKQIKSLP